MDISLLNSAVKELKPKIDELFNEVNKVIVGKRDFIEKMFIALISDGHVLVEGVPGLAKSLAISTFAETLGLDFQRIQFTPDLLPADITGTMIFNQKTGEFTPKKGPVFHNFILADEINRAPAKVQSALLEAMQEKQVTIGDNTYKLPKPFLVMATQNPLEQEGTYTLPEAQIDRFMMKIILDYPTKQEEKEIINRMAGWTPPTVKKVMDISDIEKIKQTVENIYIDEKVIEYLIDLIFATRYLEKYKLTELKGMIKYGASPRASIALIRGAKAQALLQGRGFVTPDDIRTIGIDVLRHRIILSFEAEAEGLNSETIIKKIYDEVEVP